MLFEEELDCLLKPGYMPMETGYCRLPNGQMYIATFTPMPGCKGEWIDWWFGTGLRDSDTYKHWNPKSHLFYKWDEKWKPGRYIGASHYGEIAMGDKIFKFKLTYNDPNKYFDTLNFKDENIKTIFCGEGYTPDGLPNFRVIRVVRDTDYGCEIRTRFWNDDCTEDMAQVRLEYSINSMAMLAGSLKSLKNASEKPETVSAICCKFCQSTTVVRNGWRKNAQYYLCKNCGRGFIDNQALPKMKFPFPMISAAVHNYYNGSSLNQICKAVEQRTNIAPSRSTIYRWVTRLTENALGVENNNRPLVGDIWALYQTVVDLKDKKYWLISVVDLETHFLLAVDVCFNLTKIEIKSLIEAAMGKAARPPSEMFTNIDGQNLEGIELAQGPGYKRIHVNTLINQEFYPDFLNTWHKNVEERLKPGHAKDVEKSSQIITKGFAFHHNYISSNEESNRVPALVSKVKYPIGGWNNVIKYIPNDTN